MSFTYDLDDDIGKVRLELLDTSEATGAGVKPDGTNFSDEELQVLLNREASVMCAVAGACEILARGWARVANTTIGPRREDLGKVADDYSKRAQELRAQYGGASGGFAVSFVRNDGYAAEAATESEFT